jgi:murein DD-endopeptidase MepM/ murein hydrolase activator NlpD
LQIFFNIINGGYMMRLATLVFVLTVTITANGQFFAPANYARDYFRNPLNVPISLSGNFGELRPNHYHMGFDIRTQQRENLPVYASADGYIARVKIEPAGFGRAIYINHPNGYTTVYCHLNDFSPALEGYVKQQQYRLESWRVMLDIPAEIFPVKKGDFLAYSGNTGGSQAPHLHFEVRQTADDVNRNPMLFGFPLPDDTKPTISRLAWYDRRLSIYEQSAHLVPIKKSAGGYTTVAPLITVSTPLISFSLSANDTHSGSTNANGIFEADLFDNDQPVIAFQMDNISYNSTRNLNAHIDYKTRATGGPFLQQLFELPGYLNSIYKEVGGNGTLDISDGNEHAIRIAVKDGYGNTVQLQTKVRYTGQPSAISQLPGKLFYPLMIDGFEGDDCEFYIGERCLYDSVHIGYKKTAPSATNVVSAVHSIGATYIPMQDSMLVRIKPAANLSPANLSKVVMQRFAGSRKEVQKVSWQQGWASARFRDFGSFQLVLDEEPPVIVPVGLTPGADLRKASRIAFTVKDNLDAFKNVRTELDGQWLRFTNDKGRTFIYRFDEKCGPGAHTLTITAADEAGNVTTKSYNFTR